MPTGLLENSTVYYVAERALERAGVDPGTIELVPVAQVPARLELLLAGKVEAAVLPEPLATLAVRQGAQRLADSAADDAASGVLLFRDTVHPRAGGRDPRILPGVRPRGGGAQPRPGPGGPSWWTRASSRRHVEAGLVFPGSCPRTFRGRRTCRTCPRG